MKPTIALLCTALAAVPLIQAQDVKPAQPADAPAASPSLPMDKVSYFIGKNVGNSILKQQEKIDLKEFTEGVKDALTSKKSSSYSMGTGLGQQFASEGIPIDIEKFIAGITHTVKPGSDKPAYTEEELTAAMASFEIFMKAKAEANMTPEQRAEQTEKLRQSLTQEVMPALTRLRSFTAQEPVRRMLPWFIGLSALGGAALAWSSFAPAPQPPGPPQAPPEPRQSRRPCGV